MKPDAEMMSWVMRVTSEALNYLNSLFIFSIGLLLLWLICLYFIDRSQTVDAIRHNYPVVGRFRSLFSTLGEFFRQYFFAMDREEMPFNRAEREWVYKSSKGVDNTIAFGSTKNLNAVGTAIFVACPFPALDEQACMPPPVIFGAECPNPYTSQSLINISAMSYGALSKPAVQALSNGAKMAGCWLNTGEGGLAPYHLEGGADIVFQLGTAKYGVRDQDGGLDDVKLAQIAQHDQVKMIEIKLSQGAKPGKGGILPAAKVSKEIADIRGIPEGKASISPNRHPEIDNVNDLLDFIAHVKAVSQLPVGFKMVVGCPSFLDQLLANILVRNLAEAPDFITIDSGDGGTGAAPMPLMDNVGMPIKEALPQVIDKRAQYGLRDRIKIIASGKLITPAEVAWAYCAGVDTVVSARGFMLALGCIQALKCNKNTCPTGITTHNKKLQSGLNPANKAVRVKNYVSKIHYGVGLIAHSCGVPHARALERKHCRIVQDTGKSLPLDELYPLQEKKELQPASLASSH